MKAVLSEIELRESIRRALMKSLVLEGEDELEAPASFYDKLFDIGRALLNEKVDIVIGKQEAAEGFQFDTEYGAWWMSSPAYSSIKGVSLEKLMNNQKLKESLDKLGLPESDLMRILFEIQDSKEIASADSNPQRGFYRSLNMPDSGPAGLHFFTNGSGKISAIHLVFSHRKIADFIVGARQAGIAATPAGSEKFSDNIEKMISALVPSKGESK